jgi:hypothetical protein
MLDRQVVAVKRQKLERLRKVDTELEVENSAAAAIGPGW